MTFAFVGFSLGQDTITVSVPASDNGALDNHFMPVAGAPTQTQVQGCSVQPVSSSEVIAYTDLTVDDMKAICPPVSLLVTLPTDAEIIWRSDVYQLRGNPQVWNDLGGNLDHITLYLRKARATNAS